MVHYRYVAEQLPSSGTLLSKLDKHNMPVHITEIVKLQLNTMASNLSFPSSLFIRLLKILYLQIRY